ncbi:MAG TPA: xanthine dehydrogenase family protein subunit M [Xanthobacteraceae bacterium]|nr:xanthine dehydrogenase family protein subunit M [Xanthobacteraceae bacterium]
MKPPSFEYAAPTSLREAVAILAGAKGEAKILAGGQSLVPMLNFRLLKPQVLVDINRIPDLDYIVEHKGGLRVGALTRHRMLETSALVARHFPVITEAMRHVAHLAIRNRGTIGGSLSHADPAAELALIALLLDAKIKAEGPSGTRSIGARDFFIGAMTTALEDAEIVREIEFPALPPPTGWGFEEFAQRLGDFAIVAAAATVSMENGRCVEARIALIGGETVVRAPKAEGILKGSALDEAAISAAAKAAGETTEFNSDLRASGEFRRHLAEVLTRRALTAAKQRPLGELP